MQHEDDFDLRGEAEQASDGDLDKVLRPARFEDFTGQRASMDNLKVLSRPRSSERRRLTMSCCMVLRDLEKRRWQTS